MAADPKASPATSVPVFDLADRMRKSLRVSGVSVGQAAAHLEVTRETVSTWINGHHKPTAATLRAWAQLTGVPYEWLRFGELGTALAAGAVLVYPGGDARRLEAARAS